MLPHPTTTGLMYSSPIETFPLNIACPCSCGIAHEYFLLHVKVYMTGHCMADDARDMPRGAEVLVFSSFWSPALTAGAIQYGHFLQMRTPEVRYNSDLSRIKQV